MVELSDYYHPNLVAFLESDTRNGVIKELVSLLNREGKLVHEEDFYRAILEREKLVSTGIGMGVAIPHAKLPSYHHFFIAIGISKKGIDWDAIDGAPVHLVFMIGGPDDKQPEYLQILSQLTLAIKDDLLRKKLFKLTASDDIVKLLNGAKQKQE